MVHTAEKKWKKSNNYWNDPVRMANYIVRNMATVA